MKRCVLSMLIVVVLVLAPFSAFTAYAAPNLWNSDKGKESTFNAPIGSFTYDRSTQIYTLHSGGTTTTGSRYVFVGELTEPINISESFCLSYEYVSGSIGGTGSLATSYFTIELLGLTGSGTTVTNIPLIVTAPIDREYYNYSDYWFGTIPTTLANANHVVFALNIRSGMVFNNLRFKVQLERGGRTPWKPWEPDSLPGKIDDVGTGMGDIYTGAGDYQNMGTQAVTDVTAVVLSATPLFTGVWAALPQWVWMLLAVSLAIVIGRKILGR